MTPAIDLLNQHKIQFKIHQYQHDSKSESYGYEAAEKLGVDINRVFKTLVLETDQKQLVVAVISVNDKLNLKKLAKACCVKKIILADRQTVQKSTGYIIGGVSPLGQKKQLKTFMDNKAKKLEKIFISAGRRGLEVEIRPVILAQLLSSNCSDLCSEK